MNNTERLLTVIKQKLLPPTQKEQQAQEKKTAQIIKFINTNSKHIQTTLSKQQDRPNLQKNISLIDTAQNYQITISYLRTITDNTIQELTDQLQILQHLELLTEELQTPILKKPIQVKYQTQQNIKLITKIINLILTAKETEPELQDDDDDDEL